jgi:glycosyltransferase involved in cell wall biosynthesis
VTVQPCFLFPRISISEKSLLNLLERLNHYGSIWSAQHPTIIWVYIQRSRKLEEVLESRRYEFIRIIPLGESCVKNIFSPIVKRRFKSLDGESLMLICGDLFLAPLMAKFINSREMSNFPIQISLHGNPTLNNGGFLRIVKKLLLRYAVRISSSIRIVSKHLADEVLKDFDIAGKKVLIAPIPTKLPGNLITKDKNNYLAFVGRVHSERSPLEWCEITNGYLAIKESAEAIVVGDGSLVKEMKLSILPNLRKRVHFLGEVEHENLEKYWPKISVLLTTAKSEGFGLTIREALTRGVFVVARENALTVSISETYRGIYVYRDVAKALDIISSLDKKIFDETDRIENVNLVSSENAFSLSELMQSWV